MLMNTLCGYYFALSQTSPKLKEHLGPNNGFKNAFTEVWGVLMDFLKFSPQQWKAFYLWTIISNFLLFGALFLLHLFIQTLRDFGVKWYSCKNRKPEKELTWSPLPFFQQKKVCSWYNSRRTSSETDWWETKSPHAEDWDWKEHVQLDGGSGFSWGEHSVTEINSTLKRLWNDSRL